MATDGPVQKRERIVANTVNDDSRTTHALLDWRAV
jgi:hypothetical protein